MICKQSVVYPFVRELLPYFQPWTAGMLKKSGIEVAGLVAANRFDAGRDIAYLDNRGATGVTLRADLQPVLETADTLLVPAGEYTEEFRRHLLEVMRGALKSGKDVRCGCGLSAEEEELLREAGAAHGADIAFSRATARDIGRRIIQAGREKKGPELLRTGIPVLFVADTAPATNGTDIALGVASLLEEKGYGVCAVLEPGNAQMFGFHGWDEALAYDHDATSLDEYVHDINAYFSGLDLIEKPDLIVAKLPKGPIAINKYEYNGFGLYSHLFFQAVNPDYFILCLLSGSYDGQLIREYGDLFEKRFGHGFDSIHLSNALPDMVLTPDTKSFQVLYLGQERINSYIEENLRSSAAVPIVNGLTREGIAQMCRHVEDTLSSYSDCTSVI